MAILDMFFSNKILANNDAELPDSIGKLPSGEDVGSMYNKLTKEAKEKLLDYLTDLLEQPKYRADNLEPNK